MEKRSHNGLTPGEREAFASLPRERAPSRLLEERTVRALRERALIRAGSARAGGLRPWIAAASVAAAVALFTSGLAVGQWMGARRATGAFATAYPNQTERAAALVQTTGSAYTAALAGLVEATEAADPAEVRQAREVALAALWAAAGEVARLVPDDPLTVQILQTFERVRAERSATQGARNVVWF